MKGIVITTANEMYVRDFAEPLYQTAGEAVGGGIELVHPRRLAEPYCMIVNDEGLLQGLPLNLLGSYLYMTDKHGSPIVGNIVLMKDGLRNGEPDIVGLDDKDIARLSNAILLYANGAIHWLDHAPEQEAESPCPT